MEFATNNQKENHQKRKIASGGFVFDGYCCFL